MCCFAWRCLVAALGLAFFFLPGQALAYGVVPKQTTTVWCVGNPATCGPNALNVFDGYAKLPVGSGGWVWSWNGAATCGAPTGTPPNAIIYCSRKASGSLMATRPDGSTYVAQTSSTTVSANLGDQQGIDCPPDSSVAGDQCQCGVGFKPGPGGCERYNCPSGGSYTAQTQPDVTVPSVGNVCQAGCTATPSKYSVGSDGTIYAHWPFKYSGKTCGGEPDPNGVDQKGDKGFEEQPTRCTPEQCPGTVNGQSVCVPCTKEVSPGGTEKTPQPVAPDEAGIDGVKGAETKEEQHECDGTSCTTTSVYKDGQGNVVGEGKQEKPRESFCQENPGLAICKEGAFAGSCDGGFTCEGDAVNCAIAREQHKRACEWAQVDQGLVDAGAAAVAGGLLPEGHPFRDAEQKSFSLSTLLDQSNPIGGGCPVDEVFSVAGHSVVLPFSSLCGALGIMGNIAVAFALLAALRIVFA